MESDWFPRMRMDCKGIQKNCEPYLDKELEAASSEAFCAHIQLCPPCARLVDERRRFHSLLKKLYSGHSTQAPASLKGRIYSALDTGRVVPMAEHLRPVKLRWPVAAAASFMLGMSGLLSVSAMGMHRQCPLVMGAEHEHCNIVAGGRPVFIRSENTREVAQCLSKHLGRKFSVPNLSHCELFPIAAGRVKIDGLPEGVYVEYARCHCGKDSVTLMAIDTTASPYGEVVREKYKAAAFGDHKILSWHAASDGMLYIVVTKLPLSEALQVAEIAGR